MAASETPTLISSEKTVTAAALTPVSRRVKSLTLVAKTGNTGQVYVGGSDVASTTNDGVAPGDTLMVPSPGWLDLNDV